MIKSVLFNLGCLVLASAGFAVAGEERVIQLKAGDEASSIRPPFSPKGTALSLVSQQVEGLKGHDHLVTKASLREGGQMMALARSTAGGAYDLAFIDTDLDGSLTDEASVTGTVKERRGKWWSSFDASFQSSHVSLDSLPAEGDYPVSLWAVVEVEDARPESVRYSGDGFFTGSVEVESTTYHLYVKDVNNDGLITKDDYWGISAEGVKGRVSYRSIDDFSWANGKAWKITMGNSQGTQVTFVEHLPGMTQEEDKDARNPYKADEELARAAKPLSFGKDYEQALKQAREENKPLLIKFETTWCGPCKTMTRLVFSAQNVVDAASDVICLKVDGDERKDLVEKYKIAGYPHLLLLNAKGEELKRAVGYQTAKKTIALMQTATE